MNTDVEFTESNQIKPMSGMAVTAFVMTILFCIPVLPLVGLLLGLGALGRTSTDGPFRGRPLAIIAIILGLLFTAGQTYTTVKFVEVGGMVADSIMVVVTGPDDAMEGAFKGDLKQTNDWWLVGQTPSAARTEAFVSEARRRFGEFKSAAPDDGTSARDRGAPGFNSTAVWATLCAAARAVRSVWPVWTRRCGAPDLAGASASGQAAGPARAQ